MDSNEKVTDYLQAYADLNQLFTLATANTRETKSVLKTKFGEIKHVHLLVSLHEKTEQEAQDFSFYVILMRVNEQQIQQQQEQQQLAHNNSVTEFEEAMKDDKTREEFVLFCKKGALLLSFYIDRF